MDVALERKLWRAAGCLSSLIALGFFVWCQVYFYETADMTHEPLWTGIAGAFCLLTAIACFVAARILGAILGSPEGARAIVWKLLVYFGIPLGVITIVVERLRTTGIPLVTSNMKSVYVAGAFAIMAGVIALVGERCVHRLTASGRPG